MTRQVWFNSVRRWTQPSPGAAGRISWRIWIVALCLGLAWLWLHEHDARIRQAASLDRARRETAAEVADLKKQAAEAVRAANVENARTIARLQARRQHLERRDLELSAQYAALRQHERAQAAQVATLPTSEVVTRVAAQLGLEAPDFAAPGAAENSQAAAGPSEGSSGAGSPEIPALPLSASGARKVEAALAALEACRTQRGLLERQISNGRERAAADAQTVERQSGSIARLNQALAAKDRILARQEREYRAELRAARGTFWGRLGRTAKHVAIGVAVGVVLGVAVK